MSKKLITAHKKDLFAIVLKEQMKTVTKGEGVISIDDRGRPTKERVIDFSQAKQAFDARAIREVPKQEKYLCRNCFSESPPVKTHGAAFSKCEKCGNRDKTWRFIHHG